jgi:glycosyltransferase 2 family protein
MRKYRNRIVIGFALSLVIYVGLLLVVDSREKLLTEGVVPELQKYPWLLLIPVVLLTITSWVFRFGEWHYYLGVVGARDKISLLDSAVIFVTGFIFAVSPGKIAEVLKAVILKVKTDFPIAKSAPIVVAERVVDGIAVLVITFLAVFLAGDSLDLGDSRFLIYLSTALLIVGLIAIQIRPLAYFFLNIVAKLPFIQRIHQPLVDFYESSREVFQLRHVIPTAILGVFSYLADAVVFTIIIAGFGVPLSWDLFLQATFISGVAAALGALSGVPNGAGITEISNAGMLYAIVGAQNPAFTLAAAVTAALLQGFFHKWFRVLVGLLVAFIFRKRLFPEALEDAVAEMEAKREHKQSAYSSSQTVSP